MAGTQNCEAGSSLPAAALVSCGGVKDGDVSPALSISWSIDLLGPAAFATWGGVTGGMMVGTSAAFTEEAAAEAIPSLVAPGLLATGLASTSSSPGCWPLAST